MTTVVNLKRGDSLHLLFSVLDSAGDAYDLSDCTARLQIRRQAGARVYATATSDPANGLTLDALAGTIALDIDFAVTEAMNPGTYVADLELTFSGTDRQSTETIQLVVAADITQDLPA